MHCLQIARKTLVFNYRQYRSLFLVCMTGVCIMAASIFISDGMLKAARQKARQYYGGDIMLMGGYEWSIPDAKDLIEKIRPHVPSSTQFYERFDYDAARTALFFEGATVRQRIIKGVDFEAEKDLFSAFKFTDGGIATSDSRDTMILSVTLAEELGIRAGDSITIMVRTIYGYTNTRSLVVTGIFLDSSLFGKFTSYMDIHSLREISGYPSDYVNRISLFYPKNEPGVREAEKLHSELSEEMTLYPMFKNKKTYYDIFGNPDAEGYIEPPAYALIPLDANIEELQMLTDAIRTILAFIIVILLVIIAVGIGSTYRVIAMKRITEIGTYRSLGMTPARIQKLFATETAILLSAGYIAGIILALIICQILAQFNFSFIPAFDIFLTRGKLISSYNILKVIGLLAVITVTTIASVLYTIRKTVHISPVTALAATV